MALRVLYPAVVALAALAVPAVAKEAACEITIDGQRIDGPCNFIPRKKGSFDVSMTDGQRFNGARVLSLDVLRKGIGEIHDGQRSYGAANRSDRDPACWVAADVSLCVRDKGARGRSSSGKAAQATGGFTHPTRFPRVVRGRCHMESCWWLKVTSLEVMGQGTPAVPGERIRVRVNYAESGDQPRPDSPLWNESDHMQLFCSMARPSFLRDGEGWVALTPDRISGVNEGMVNVYLNLCHAGRYDDDPYNAAKLGYHRTEDRNFKTFGQLTSR